MEHRLVNSFINEDIRIHPNTLYLYAVIIYLIRTQENSDKTCQNVRPNFVRNTIIYQLLNMRVTKTQCR